MQNLKQNTTLQGGRYKIIETLGQGGFGITYLAYDCNLDRNVAIKEFFMKELCKRDDFGNVVTISSDVDFYRRKFLKEACNMARFTHPNIVHINNVFEENNSAYYDMTYIENGSLADKVKKEGYLSELVATRYILQIAEALDYIHKQKVNHLDVKPANVMLNENDEPILIDFGLSKRYGDDTINSSALLAYSDGYAPIEQYNGIKEFSPATDIYALGATFFYLLTGVKPKSAAEINEDGVDTDLLKSRGVSQLVISVICKSMESRKKLRMDNARTFIDEIKNHNTISTEKTSSREVSSLDDNVDGTIHSQEQNVDDTVLDPKNKSKGYIDNNNTSKSVESSSKSFSVNGVSFTMVEVKGGSFLMGATSEQSSDAYDNEKPVHKVTLSSYYIGQTQVTQRLWKAVMGSNPSRFKSWFKVNNKPVENVSWNDCQTFIEKLNTLTGKTFRLPTEAEWEFACRGGNKSKGYKYSGSNDIGSVAWYEGNSGYATHEVGKLKPNELGLYDMSGNVWEWCGDWHGNYSSNAQTNPTGPASGSLRVYRGGCWYYYARCCRSSNRYDDFSPDYRYGSLGLRLCLSE